MPEMIVHFDVSRERSIAAIQQAMVEEQEIFLVAQKSIETENPGQDDVYETGTVAYVKQLIKLMLAAVKQGETVCITVSGMDEEACTAALEKAMQQDF